ncbi:hypothetical protein KIN_30500 [Litoreibacter roseus]|uniref:Spermidine synthase n=1 Tax=Litoreibacter roseus TaxID=2601869 RepID=A0A6N6JI81_9RHOB|nr:hypothetical protein KIN_30500 [Litoreibacter roseus]
MAPVVFTLTIFLSASLLFFVQPLFAKIVLPHIGGAAGVWTTAMLFFQTVLIAGYVYAHLSSRYLRVMGQIALHLLLWAAALIFLPLSIPEGWRYDGNASTSMQTLGLFAVGVGLPFAVLSASAPLIQSWYAKSGGPNADDPYFLYGASNLGSLIALLSFPLVAEPLLGVTIISGSWAIGFVVLGACLLASGWFARGRSTPLPTAKSQTDQSARPTAKQLTTKRIAGWLLMAFIPSSLMLGVTTQISTDIGSVPLVWAIPLSLYLLTFVIAFSHRTWINRSILSALFAAALPVLAFTLMGHGSTSITIPRIGLMLLCFFIVAIKSHRDLYDARPDRRYLTIFYVIMSVGGALGGLFNSIIAPNLFADIQETKITVVLAALLLLRTGQRVDMRQTAIGLLAGVAISAAFVAPYLVADGGIAQKGLTVLLPIVLLGALWMLREAGVAAFVALTTLLLSSALNQRDNMVLQDRSFFGVHQVFEEDGLRKYYNGTTLHGAQSLADASKPPRPLSYYHPNGPMAQILTSGVGRQATDIGVVGLGVGSLACYRQPGQKWQFYEIDRMVDQIARNTELFNFLSACTPDAPTHLGDARIVLQHQNDVKYDILVIDAYSSDAVPIHLTTLEALDIYKDRLKPSGILVFHISNRYFNIEVPLARSAPRLGLDARMQGYRPSAAVWEDGDTPSRVVIMSEDSAKLDTLKGAADGRSKWVPLTDDGGRVWTDEYANIFEILR